MADDDKARDEGGAPLEQLDRLRAGPDDPDPRERFRKTTRIALLLAYDLIDKLRYWEKDSLARPDEELEARLGHLNESVTRLREAYLRFSDVDL